MLKYYKKKIIQAQSCRGQNQPPIPTGVDGLINMQMYNICATSGCQVTTNQNVVYFSLESAERADIVFPVPNKTFCLRNGAGRKDVKLNERSYPKKENCANDVCKVSQISLRVKQDSSTAKSF